MDLEKNISAQKLNTGKKEGIPEERLQAWILDNLEARGILQTIGGQSIVDIDALKQYAGKNAQVQFKFEEQKISVSKKDVLTALKDAIVLSREDFAKNQAEGSKKFLPKPLFVVPENNKAAFTEINSQEGYLKPWELYDNNQTNWNIDYRAKNGEPIDLFAWAVADKLKYLQIQRAKDGQVTIADPRDGERKKISGDLLKEVLGIGRLHVGDGSSSGSIHRILEEHPDLMRYNVLRESDFKVSGERANFHTRKELNFGETNSKYFSSKLARYYICNEAFVYKNGNDQERIPRQELKIVQLDPQTIGIVRVADGANDLKYTFNFLSPDEIREKRQTLIARKPELEQDKSGLAAHTVVGKPEMEQRLQPWKITADNPRWPNEDATQYAERIKKISDYAQIDRISEKIDREAGVNMHNLAWREQQWLATFHHQYDTRGDIGQLYNFGKQYGLEGFRTFLNCEYDFKNGRNIVEIGKRMRSDDARKVFNKTNEILDAIEKNGKQAEELFGKQVDVVDLKMQLFKKAASVLENFHAQSGKDFHDGETEKLLSDLEKSKTEIILLAAGLKAAKEKGEAVDLESIKNLDLSIKDFGSELSEEEKREMLSVAERNWNQNPTMKDAVVKSFGDSLQSTSDQKFYTLKFQEKIAAFVRFAKTERGSLYAGSFNVDPDARGLGIGDEMMDEALRTEALTSVIEATVSPRIPAGTAYVERVGFVIDGIIADYHRTGEPLFSIQIDNKKNESYAYRNEGKQDVISQDDMKKQCASLEMLEHLIGSESFVLRFDMKNDFDAMKKVMEELLIAKDDDGKDVEGQSTQNKYRITRYFREDKRDEEKDVRYFVFERMR